MNAKSDNPAVISEFNSLKRLVPFGIKHNKLFIEIKDISINTNGKLFYQNNNNEKKSVSSLIKHTKRLQTVRWLDHLYFIDGYGKETKFKKFVSQTYNLNFT
uniref:Uncharacterized protein n=1 Tax=viral metagenome TaxID=1070528 RepID=A0A6C0HNY2_9ZZZZ